MSARKGARKERQLVARLQDHGLVAHRVPLSGAMKGYPEDVVVECGEGQLRLELKWRRNASGFKRVIDWYHEADGALLLPDFLVVTDAELAAWVRARCAESNLALLDVDPKDVTPRKGLQAWLDGADALVLRQAHDTTYYVCIPLYCEPSDGERGAIHQWARSHMETEC